MALVVLALAAGLAAGYARGGRLRALAAHPPIRSRLILTALGMYAVGVAGSWVWEPLLPAMTALCWLVLGFYAWLNRSYHGARLVALGLAANGLVILLNGAMPVSEAAEARAGVERTASTADGASAVGDSTVLPWLGKVVPVAFPPRPETVSPGDIAVAAGCAAALATAMTGRRIEPGQRTAPIRRDAPARRADPVRNKPAADRATIDADVTADAVPESPRVTA